MMLICVKSDADLIHTSKVTSRKTKQTCFYIYASLFTMKGNK